MLTVACSSPDCRAASVGSIRSTCHAFTCHAYHVPYMLSWHTCHDSRERSTRGGAQSYNSCVVLLHTISGTAAGPHQHCALDRPLHDAGALRWMLRGLSVDLEQCVTYAQATLLHERSVFDQADEHRGLPLNNRDAQRRAQRRLAHLCGVCVMIGSG